MKTRHSVKTSSNSQNPIRKGGARLGAKTQPNGLSAEFADMFALLPDAEPIDPRPLSQQIHQSQQVPLSQQIIEHLEKHKIAAVRQLRIEVHEGVVVIAGEVPSAYEKQLVGHFCRQLPSVVKFVDGMVVRKTDRAVNRPAPARRPARKRREWSLPFRLSHAGAALGLVILAWSAISLGRGPGGPERLAVNPVIGELRVEGLPAAGATIFLHPQDPSIPVRPIATVSPDGTFEFTTYQPGDGAPAGRYKATIEWRRPVPGQSIGEDMPPNVVPAAYTSAQTTPVNVIVAKGENTFPSITFQN